MIYDYTVETLAGKSYDLAQLKGKVALIVNTASQCGFAPQLNGLERLYEEYKDQDFIILGFPCDQFGDQEYDEVEQIEQVCYHNYGVTFPMMAKVKVNGPDALPLFKELKDNAPGMVGAAIKWNFTKFLIDREGNIVERYAPTTPPSKIAPDVAKLL